HRRNGRGHSRRRFGHEDRGVPFRPAEPSSNTGWTNVSPEVMFAVTIPRAGRPIQLTVLRASSQVRPGRRAKTVKDKRSRDTGAPWGRGAGGQDDRCRDTGGGRPVAPYGPVGIVAGQARSPREDRKGQESSRHGRRKTRRTLRPSGIGAGQAPVATRRP